MAATFVVDPHQPSTVAVGGRAVGRSSAARLLGRRLGVVVGVFVAVILGGKADETLRGCFTIAIRRSREHGGGERHDGWLGRKRSRDAVGDGAADRMAPSRQGKGGDPGGVAASGAARGVWQ